MKAVFSPQSGLPPGFEYNADPRFMQMAIAEAEPCTDRGDHPVGAVVTRNYWDGESTETLEFPISYGNNQVHLLNDPFAHAEMQALRGAISAVGKYSLDQCVLYTTHECCPMCSGAVVNTRLMGVVYGTSIEDIPILLQDEPEIKWRSNSIRMAQIIQGRKENGRGGQFIIGGVEREECFELLRTTAKLADYHPKKLTREQFLRDCGFDEIEVDWILNGHPSLRESKES